MATLTMILVLIGLMIFRVPICVSMGISGFVGYQLMVKVWGPVKGE